VGLDPSCRAGSAIAGTAIVLSAAANVSQARMSFPVSRGRHLEKHPFGELLLNG